MRSRTSRLPMLLAALLCLASSAGARTLKIATVVPDGSSWMQEMRRAGKVIEDETAGRVKLKFYPGGVMGNDKTVLRKVRAGQLQGGAFPSGALAQVFADVDLYSLPLVFRSYDEVDYVRARMDAILEQGLEERGFEVLAIGETGFAYLMSQKPVRRVDDLEGAKVWIQEDDVMSETALQTAGVSPVQLPLADVYTALQTGLIDTVAAPPVGTIAFQWHTKLDYFTDVPLMYLVGLLVVDARAFGRLQPADQQVVRSVVAAAVARLDEANREGEADARRALAQQGVEFVQVSSPEELERWHDITRRALVSLRRKGIYSDELIERIHEHLESYRSRDGRGE